MVLPVVAYGHPVLKHVAEEIEENSPEIQQLIADMFETMYHTEGVGLAVMNRLGRAAAFRCIEV